MSVTLEQLILAFELWESDFRSDPTKYSTDAEVASLDVSQVSIERGHHMMQLLEAVKKP